MRNSLPSPFRIRKACTPVRPGLLSKAAKGFQCAVTLTKGEKTADLKKIFCSNGSGRQGRRQHHICLRRRRRKLQRLRLEKMFAEIK